MFPMIDGFWENYIVFGIFVMSGMWADKRRHFIADYFIGIFLVMLWPIAIIANMTNPPANGN